ncbi:high-affinity Fe2+/Pb2+ permease [Streptosporangium album]|uniref:High-affinity Fe2+/Pb2+ permease n=1 Tax=Streptosporangium album TaxID=47479 RepID=A0A7W7W7G1_9ACTN|nr:hypothetical protein [Streptosporangium album]MBB4936014.1 high-affinity Fe2+/Pb2+ permease [Streptosporangium album]
MPALLVVVAVLSATVRLGLIQWGLDRELAGVAAGLLFGLLIGAALPGWCQQLGDRLGISARARKRRR